MVKGMLAFAVVAALSSLTVMTADAKVSVTKYEIAIKTGTAPSEGWYETDPGYIKETVDYAERHFAAKPDTDPGFSKDVIADKPYEWSSKCATLDFVQKSEDEDDTETRKVTLSPEQFAFMRGFAAATYHQVPPGDRAIMFAYTLRYAAGHKGLAGMVWFAEGNTLCAPVMLDLSALQTILEVGEGKQFHAPKPAVTGDTDKKNDL